MKQLKNRMIGDIGNLFQYEEENYYKPVGNSR